MRDITRGRLLTVFAVAAGLLAASASASAVEICITSPNGGETWAAGSPQTVTWTSSDSVGSVSVGLVRLVGGEYQYVAWLGFVPLSDGTLDCTVPIYAGDGNNYAVQLYWSDGTSSVTDYSDAPFEITGSSPMPAITVTSPDGGEIWNAGTTHPVTWTAANPVGNVSVELYRLVGGEYQWAFGLGSAPMADGRYDWAISPYLANGNNYVVRLTWADGGFTAMDYGDGPFEITGSAGPILTLTSPNGGETWQSGTTQTITWTSTNSIGDVEIALLQKVGGDYQWVTELGSAPMADGTYDAPVPTCIGNGNNFMVRLSWTGEDAAAEDYSDASFHVHSSVTPADFNGDCLVDEQDVAAFEACMTGPRIPYDAQNLPNGCSLLPDQQGILPADFDGDGDVDQDDFGVLQRCYSGSDTPADPDCAK